MQTAMSYIPVLRKTTRQGLNFSFWDRSLDFFQKNQTLDCIHAFISFLDETLATKRDLEEGREIELLHGSVRVTMKVDGDKLQFHCPFVSIPEDEQYQVPLMRRMVEINMMELLLAQIKSKDGSLHFQYEGNVANCHPEKLLDVVREICLAADHYDDVFEKKFHVKCLDKAPVKEIAPAEGEKVYTAVQNYLTEMLEHCQYCFRNQWLISCYDILDNAHSRLKYVLNPHGVLRSDLAALRGRLSRRFALEALIHDGVKDFKDILAMPKETFLGSLYSAKFLLPDKVNLDINAVLNQIQSEHGLLPAVIQLRQVGDYQKATYVQFNMISGLLNRFYLPGQITQFLESGIEAAAKQPWRKASDLLWMHLGKCFDLSKAGSGETSGNPPGGRKGFF